MLPAVIAQIKTPALFWLDAHYSGGTTADSGQDPIVEELKSIFQSRNCRHVVLIDDARAHNVEAIARWIPGDVSVSVRNDLIRIIPRTC